MMKYWCCGYDARIQSPVSILDLVTNKIRQKLKNPNTRRNPPKKENKSARKGAETQRLRKEKQKDKNSIPPVQAQFDECLPSEPEQGFHFTTVIVSL
jgi:hypothetical protein